MPLGSSTLRLNTSYSRMLQTGQQSSTGFCGLCIHSIVQTGPLSFEEKSSVTSTFNLLSMGDLLKYETGVGDKKYSKAK